MSERSRELADRRKTLQLRAAIQRRAITVEVGALESRLRGADRAFAVASGLLRNPLVIGVAATALILIGRSRGLRWVGRALLLASGVGRVVRAARKI